MASKLQLTGGCLCGAIGYRLGGNFRAHYCHCGMCRRATGSAFAVLVWTDRENLQWTGPEPEQYRSSPIATRGFCRQCGTSLTLHYDGGKEIAVHAGSLDQPERTVPQYHYGSEGRLPWVDCGRGLPEHHTKERW
ncbi:MAG TPA: GFA family protein [Rhizobiaceae bacterium]|nr:GFA family protein [Rhizobiaceae bacterium]